MDDFMQALEKMLRTGLQDAADEHTFDGERIIYQFPQETKADNGFSAIIDWYNGKRYEVWFEVEESE